MEDECGPSVIQWLLANLAGLILRNDKFINLFLFDYISATYRTIKTITIYILKQCEVVGYFDSVRRTIAKLCRNICKKNKYKNADCLKI